VAVRRKHIRLLAEQLLKKNRIQSPPVPVEEIAESLGISVVRKATDDDLSGFLFRDRKRSSAVIGVNADHPENRRNFTIGHEIGHFLLHEGDDVHVDRRFQIKLRGEASSKGVDAEEIESNLFAAELLMPARFLQKDLEQIAAIDLNDENEDAVAELAKRYGVSAQAMMFRLANLGYVKL
jgi:Zn-dependent peptidase ImmA (M78 family)